MSSTFQPHRARGDLRTMPAPGTPGVLRRMAAPVTLLLVLTVALPVPALAMTGLPYDELTPAPAELPQTPIVDVTPTEVDLTFPVAGPDEQVSFIDDFLQLRGGGSRLHAATDVMAPKHRSIHAAVGGTITFAPYAPNREGWSALGEPPYGWMVSILGDDGMRYSYIHLNNDTPLRKPGPDGTDDGTGPWLDDDRGGIEHAYAPRIVAAIEKHGTARGLRVERGEHIGWVGDSGNAKGVTPHLHLEIEVTGPDGGYRINPYHSLVAALDRDDVPEKSVDNILRREPELEPGKGSEGDGDGADGDKPAPDADGTDPSKPDAGELPPDGDDPAKPDPGSTDPAKPHPDGSEATKPVPDVLYDPPPDGIFEDVFPHSVHGPAIEELASLGILRGCDERRYCPAAVMRRGDLAVNMAAALELEVVEGTRSRFSDVEKGDPREAAIAAVDAAGILTGYLDGTFGADDGLTRAQLASVLVRAFAIPPAPEPAGFLDLPHGATHGEAIDALAAAGLTRGCGDGTHFCPGEVERRDRVATFLQRGRAFDRR